jgi:GDPmannose 4,6-dehydratase
MHTFKVTAEPILTILEWARTPRSGEPARIYQASTSELFGTTPPPQNEKSPFAPQSPYAIAKLAAHLSVKLYREAYGLYAVSGILMNHESELRPPSFVTRKITQGVARIASGQIDHITLGNLEAKRDWGYAGDYVEAMWLMLQQSTPRDFVIASGSTHTVREFVACAFAAAAEICGRPELKDWERYVRTDSRYLRPAEVPVLCGNATQACEQLGWAPKVSFHKLVALMVEHDLAAASV